MPDIEKRLEALSVSLTASLSSLEVWVRQKIAVFAGNFNEPGQQRSGFTIILTGPKESADYFRVLDEFVVIRWAKTRAAITASSLMTPLSRSSDEKIDAAGERKSPRHWDAYSFNWSMRIAPDLQMPFDRLTRIWLI